MSSGVVDTLNLLTEKLENLLNETQGYYESFLEINTMYKNGKISDKDFFQKMGDYIVSYSSLEFLSIKVIMEIKKAVDQMAGGKAVGGTQSPGLMPGMGPAGVMVPDAGNFPDNAQPPRIGTAENPIGGRVPPEIISGSNDPFTQGIVPTSDSLLTQKTTRSVVENSCASCGSKISRPNAKFCASCGSKIIRN